MDKRVTSYELRVAGKTRYPLPVTRYSKKGFTHAPKNGAGFTLIEILIAVVLTAIILSLIYGSYAASVNAMNYAQEKLDTFSLVREALDRMGEELASSFLSEKNTDLAFRGEEGKIEFVSASHERIFENSKEYDLTEISYFTETSSTETASGSESLQARREDLLLLRREDKTPDEEPFLDEKSRVIVTGLEGVEFHYYDGEEWHSEWDSKTAKKLPEAVKVTLKFPNKELFTFAYIPWGR